MISSLFVLNSLKALELYTKAAQEDGDAACGYRVSLMALKCLNNAVWDQPSGQMSFVRLGGLDMLVDLLQVCRRKSCSMWRQVVIFLRRYSLPPT